MAGAISKDIALAFLNSSFILTKGKNCFTIIKHYVKDGGCSVVG